MRFGSKYGEWIFKTLPVNRKIEVVSAGVGEDISFDVEFCSYFTQSRLVLLDPTERSRKHVEDTLERIGKKAMKEYSHGGKQSPSSYDLTHISAQQLSFLNVALWKHSFGLLLEEPDDPEHVSFRRRRKTVQPVKYFSSVEILEILKTFRFYYPNEESCFILKLDIEGSEIDVLHDLIVKKIKPCQILVEFDTLRWANMFGVISFLFIAIKLYSHRYVLIEKQGYNFTFIKRTCHEL